MVKCYFSAVKMTWPNFLLAVFPLGDEVFTQIHSYQCCLALKNKKLIYKDSSLGRAIRTSALFPGTWTRWAACKKLPWKTGLRTTHSSPLVLTASLWGTAVTSVPGGVVSWEVPGMVVVMSCLIHFCFRFSARLLRGAAALVLRCLLWTEQPSGRRSRLPPKCADWWIHRSFK